jgi:hypothetical protein
MLSQFHPPSIPRTHLINNIFPFDSRYRFPKGLSGLNCGGASFPCVNLLPKLSSDGGPLSNFGFHNRQPLLDECQLHKTDLFFLFRGVGLDWARLLRRPLVGPLYQARMIDEYGEVRGMRIDSGKRSTRRKPVSVLLRPP